MSHEELGRHGGAEIDVVIPTFRRTGHLATTMRSLMSSSRLVRSVLVVDNGRSSDARRACDSLASATGMPIVYVDPGENIGPAGATTEAMRRALDDPHDDHWLLRLDDDRPLPEGLLPLLLAEARAALDEDPSTAGVGLEGAVWNPRRARLTPPPRTDSRFVHVDYLKTGRYPLFHTRAARAIGGFRAELFFGLSEVEYGIRARRSRFTLKEASRLRHFVTRPARAQDRQTSTASSDWRRYYSLRNLLVILKEDGQHVMAAWVALTRGLIKPVLGVPASPRDGVITLSLSMRAIADAYTNRLGRRVDPYEWAERHHRLTDSGDMPRT